MSNINTQTTGALSAEMKTYYGMELLENAKPALVHNQFAATRGVPVGGGKTVEWRKFGSFEKALTPLTEGVTPDGSGISVSYITKELSQYGDYTTVSDMLGGVKATIWDFDCDFGNAKVYLSEESGYPLRMEADVYGNRVIISFSRFAPLSENNNTAQTR